MVSVSLRRNLTMPDLDYFTSLVVHLEPLALQVVHPLPSHCRWITTAYSRSLAWRSDQRPSGPRPRTPPLPTSPHLCPPLPTSAPPARPFTCHATLLPCHRATAPPRHRATAPPRHRATACVCSLLCAARGATAARRPPLPRRRRAPHDVRPRRECRGHLLLLGRGVGVGVGASATAAVAAARMPLPLPLPRE